MKPSSVFRIIKVSALILAGFIIGASFVWNVVGHACSEGSVIRFSLWPAAHCAAIAKAKGE